MCYQSTYKFYNEYIVHYIPLLHFQVPRLCLPWYSSDDCQLFPFGTDGGSLETPTPDGSPWGPHLSSGSFDRMCRQTGTPVTFRLITWCAMSHTGKVISTSTTHKSTQNFQYIVHSHTGCLRWIGSILNNYCGFIFGATARHYSSSFL